MMFIPIDPSSGLPIYRQIMDQVRRMIASGALKPGDRVPSVRDLSSSLQINHLTVGKAYNELDREGLLEKRRGLGVFVAVAPHDVGEAGREAVRETAQRLVLEARQAGLTREGTTELVEACWDDIDGGHPGGETR